MRDKEGGREEMGTTTYTLCAECKQIVECQWNPKLTQWEIPGHSNLQTGNQCNNAGTAVRSGAFVDKEGKAVDSFAKSGGDYHPPKRWPGGQGW